MHLLNCRRNPRHFTTDDQSVSQPVSQPASECGSLGVEPPLRLMIMSYRCKI